MNLDHLTDVVDSDVVVIGAGGAALRAAYEAARNGARVTLLTKGRVGSSGATTFLVAETAGFAVPDGKGDPEDGPDAHFADIMAVAAGCADPALVKVLVDEAERAARDLERWGVTFMSTRSGDPVVAMGDFATRRRNRKISRHGRPIVEALKPLIKGAGVVVFERTVAIALLHDDGGINGVVAYRDETLLAIRAPVVILAAGGAGQLFGRSLMPPDITGDGYALGYRAGACLTNLEFIQAGFGILHPGINMVMPWYWSLLPRFVDACGTPVLQGRMPSTTTENDVMRAKQRHYPFSTADASKWLEIAAKEMLDGGGEPTPHGGLFLDLTPAGQSSAPPPGSELEHFWSVSKEWLRKKGIDVDSTPIEVGLFGHSINGGLVINRDGETTVPGLLAAGENAAGPYGADRLGGNMLLACQVFGRRAGERAAELSKTRRRGDIDFGSRAALTALKHVLQGQGQMPASELRGRLTRAMARNLLITRTAASLGAALSELAELRDAVMRGGIEIEKPGHIVSVLESLNLIEVGELAVRVAQLRTESRGSHFRADFPEPNNRLAKPIIARKTGSGLHIGFGEFSPVAA